MFLYSTFPLNVSTIPINLLGQKYIFIGSSTVIVLVVAPFVFPINYSRSFCSLYITK
jgi:hypothetical protein